MYIHKYIVCTMYCTCRVEALFRITETACFLNPIHAAAFTGGPFGFDIRVEQAGERVFRDAGAGIGDVEPRRAACFGRADRDAASVRMLDGIGDEIGEEAHQDDRVAPELQVRRRASQCYRS